MPGGADRYTPLPALEHWRLYRETSRIYLDFPYPRHPYHTQIQFHGWETTEAILVPTLVAFANAW